MEGDKLFDHVGRLPGCNLFTGSGGETQDLDYKHDMKRICKLICTREGLLVDTVCVTKSVLAVWLERLTDVDWSKNTIYSLLNPDPEAAMLQRIHALLSASDTQDVPRAIKLLNLTAEIRKIDTSNLNPSECNTHRGLCLLGEMLEALIEPFINPEFSLSQQITSLVKFAHILCALFLKHETAFMPQHLYSDLQCMVRTAIFRVAHTKILDPERRVLLCLLGDDVLEILFGRTRMIGGHSPNVDVEELRNRFGSALRLDAIFEEHPEWERRPSRLKLKRARDADHLSPRNWLGPLEAKSCDVEVCWTDGVTQAETVLRKAGYEYNFSEYFRDWRTRGVDLLRPKGGKYPGISKEVDRSLGDAEDLEEPEEITDDFSFRSFDGRKVLEEEKRMNVAQKLHSVWMDIEEGKPPAHKKTILRVFTDPTLDIDGPRTTDRVLRVRCFSSGGNSWDRECKSRIHRPTDGEIFYLGSLYATAICSEQKVSIAILQSTGLKSASQYLDRAPLQEISLLESNFDVTGQILSLIPILRDPLNTETLSWVWNSRFISLDSPKARSQQVSTTDRLHHLSFTVNGRLVLPLNPRQARAIGVHDLPPDAVKGIVAEKTWVIEEKDLQEIKATLLQRLQEDETTRSRIPLFGRVRDGVFPYASANPADPTKITEHSTISIAAPTAANAPQACCICGHQVAGPDRQNHMGGHILRRLRGVEENCERTDSTVVSMHYPCGFCGQSSLNGACKLSISSGKAMSDCSRVYNFRIAAAAKVSQAKACTNVPILCKFCTQVHWKYNMHRHLQERHPTWESTPIRGSEMQEFKEKITVSIEEEARLKIPDHRRGWSSVSYAQAQDLRHLDDLPSIRDTRGDSPRRPRQTTSCAPPSIALPDFSGLPTYNSTFELLPTFNHTQDIFR